MTPKCVVSQHKVLINHRLASGTVLLKKSGYCNALAITMKEPWNALVHFKYPVLLL